MHKHTYTAYFPHGGSERPGKLEVGGASRDIHLLKHQRINARKNPIENECAGGKKGKPQPIPQTFL